MLRLRTVKVVASMEELKAVACEKKLISTINAHSYNVVRKDADFEKALEQSDLLLPDGISIVWAYRLLRNESIVKISGWDFFCMEMERLNKIGGSCFFLGSSENTLQAIHERARKDYPNIKVYSFSPLYKPVFSVSDNEQMISEVNRVRPDLLWIGMTAPKQEKWAFEHFPELQVNGHIGCIGAVFDFYAGSVKRAPDWAIRIGMEWLYRLLKEPQRLWRRYLIGNTLFLKYLIKEWLFKD